jgi:hypothetical protein
MTIERACDRSAAHTDEQTIAAVNSAKKTLASGGPNCLPGCLEQAEPSRFGRIKRIGNVEVATGIKVLGFMGKCDFN